MAYRTFALSLCALPLAFAQVQEAPPPPPVTLSTTKSGVLPVIPTETPFTGVITNQGAIVNPGPPRPGFVGPGGTATAQSNLPLATYRADLPPTMFNGLVGTTIQGFVSAVGTQSGVRFTVNLTDLPPLAQYGPFPYHIHTVPVPEDGNCTATLSHLDPTNRGELYMCDTGNPATCQVGDLAGKHGRISTEGAFQASYVDAYLSTDPSSPAFFGGLGLVIHTSNTTRLTCANFVQIGGNGTTGGTGTLTSGVPSPTSSNPAEYTGAASTFQRNVVVALGLAFAMLLL